MSSFSALEFHAGHYKGAASLAVAAEAARSLSSDRAAILVNRFIMPEGRASCRRHALETIVSVWSGWLFLISQRKITVRRRIRAEGTCAKRQRAMRKKISSFFFVLSSFLMVHGIFRSFLIFLIGRRISRWHAISTFVSGIIMRRPRSIRCRIGPGRSLRVGLVQIRISLDQNTADGPDKLSDLWIVDRANVDLLNPSWLSSKSLQSRRKEGTRMEQRGENEIRKTRENVHTRRTYKYKMFTFLSQLLQNNSRIIIAPLIFQSFFVKRKYVRWLQCAI